MRTPRREAGRLINQTVTLRTITRSRHSRTGITAFPLHLSTTTELVVINLISQHDPQPNPEFSCCSDSRFPQTLLHQFAPIKRTYSRIPAPRVYRRFTPQKAQQWITLLAQASQPLSPAAGVFPGNDPDIACHSLAIGESSRIAQKDIGRQCRDRSHTRMSHQQLGAGSLPCLLQDSLIQLFDLRFEPGVHRLQLAAPMSGVCCQW